MASPRVHTGATIGLSIVCSLSFIAGLSAMNWLYFFWAVVFGVLVDVDHLPFGRLWKAYQYGKMWKVWRVWRKFGWFDENHLDFFHTWWGLAGVVGFSLVIGAWMPMIAFGVHMLIDGGSRDQLTYSKCAPLPRSLHRFYPEWLKYNTSGIPSK